MIRYNNSVYRFLAVVPARSGSKEIRNKNIKLINGIPLIGYTANFINKINFIDNAVCSTDSKKYAKISNKYNLDTPFLRPDDLSLDYIGDVPVLKHALINSEKYYNKKFDFVIMLQPTSPIRKIKDLKDAAKYILKNKYDSLWSVSEINLKNHPLKQLVIKNNKLKFYSKGANKIIARQQLKKTYQRNGVFYIIKRNLLMHNKYINSNTGYYVIDKNIVNIDSIEDIKFFTQLSQSYKT